MPFVIDAVQMGYLTGVREDQSYREYQYRDLDVPVGILDNDFRNPIWIGTLSSFTSPNRVLA